IATLAMVRGLSKEGFGAYSLAAALVYVFGTVANFGTENVLTRDFSRSQEEGKRTLGVVAIFRIALAAPAVGLAVLASWLLGYGTVVTSVTLVAALIIPMSVYAVYLAYFSAILRSGRVMMVNIGTQAAASAGILLVLYAGWGLLALVAVETAARVAGIFVIARIGRREVPLRIRWDTQRARDVLRSCFPLFLVSAVTVLYTRVVLLMLGAYLTPADVGLYSAAARLVEMLSIINVPLAATLFPLLARFAAQDRDAFELAVDRGYRFTLILILPVAVAMSVLAAPLVTLVFGPSYAPAADVLRVLVWSQVLAFAATVTTSLMIAERMEAWNLGYQSAAFAATLLLALFAIPRWGIVGAASAVVVGGILPLPLLAASAKTRRPARFLLGSLARVATAVAPAGAILLILTRPMSVPRTFAALVLAGIVYIVFLFLTRAVTVAEVRELRRVIRRGKAPADALNQPPND
ncbi:MAG: flippase, partial [Candidatus Thermoplasmatota archaeon]